MEHTFFSNFMCFLKVCDSILGALRVNLSIELRHSLIKPANRMLNVYLFSNLGIHSPEVFASDLV